MLQGHKLEFGRAELDLDELIKVAGIAVSHANRTLDMELDRCAYKLKYDGDVRLHASEACNASRRAAAAAQDYAAAWNTLHALLEAKERCEVTIKKES